MRTHRRALAGTGTWVGAALLVLSTAGIGCATGGDASAGGEYPAPGDAGGSGGASDAASDTTGGTGGTSGKDAGPEAGGTGGQAGEAGIDAEPDAVADAEFDGAPDAPAESGSEGGSGLPVGELCTTDAECSSGVCAEVGLPGVPTKACIRPCLPNVPCPDGARCTSVPSLGHVCAPYHDEACATCTTDGDCKIQGNACLTGTGGQKYCGVDCSYDDECPAELACQTLSGNKLCVPQGGAECPCAPNRDGETRSCESSSGGITCVGIETCDGSQGAFVGCTALTPAPETCNGIDDDCNGATDDLPHATCDCTGGTCSMVCAAGYARYPSSLPESAGCPCTADAYDGNDGGACATPHTVAAVADVGGTASRTIAGTLSSDTDEDWFMLTFTDTAETGTDSFHANISFTSNPNDEFRFVVVADCSSAPSASQYTQVDACVNFFSGGVGAAPCGMVAGQNHCEDRTMTRMVGVVRNPGASSKTCASYELTVRAAGACDPSAADGCTW